MTGEAVIAEIADRGTADLPFPGMVAPTATGVRGRGLWLASGLGDRLLARFSQTLERRPVALPDERALGSRRGGGASSSRRRRTKSSLVKPRSASGA